MDYDDVEDYGQTKEIVTIHGYDWILRNVSGEDEEHTAIHCWGLDKSSKPYLLRFTDFPAFCHLELPQFIRNRQYQWTNTSAKNFMLMLNNLLQNDRPCDWRFIPNTKKLYYYRGERTFPMLRLCFNTTRSMWKCAKMFENTLKTDDWGFIKCNILENNISMIRKLLTVTNIKYSEWFRVEAVKVDQETKISTIENEYIANWQTMTPVPNEECKSWVTQPMILAFDIECYSDNHRAMPDKYNALHIAYMISCISQRHRDSSTRKRYGIIIGECNHIPTERLSNCEIIKVETEYEMIEAFAKIISIDDPDIITGYNILGFDYPYLDYRVKRWLKKWPAMGRIAGEPSVMTTRIWKSDAYGHQSINMLNMEGRITIDPFPIVKRDFKLEKYDLNTVCKKFIGKTKHDVKAVDMFISYERMSTAKKAYMLLLFQQQDNPQLASTPEFQTSLHLAKKELELEKAETTKVMEYCIQDSELVIDLFEKLNIWVGLVEMSNIVGTTIVELFTRGQQIRCVSQLYDLAARMGFVLDSRDTPGFKFTGGFVFDPIPGLYDNVICLDFASLYPSIMMAYNICYTTLVLPELEHIIPDEDCNVIEFDQEEEVGPTYVPPQKKIAIGEEEDDAIINPSNNKKDILEEKPKGRKKAEKPKVIKHYKFKFYKHVDGLLPTLVKQLVTQRRAVIRNSFQIKDAIKILEKTEGIRVALDAYLNKDAEIEDPEELKKYIESLCESQPPAAPEVITAAKKRLIVAELFNVNITKKNLDKGIADKVNEDSLSLFQLEAQIAELYKDNNKKQLREILIGLNVSKDNRMVEIDDSKMLVTTLDKRQLALKVSANSFFGFLGVHTGGMMPLIEAAMSITARGRELIGGVIKHIREKYGGEVVAGDTDSLRGHTPVLIKYSTGAIDYIQVKDLLPPNRYPTGDKEYYTPLDIEVWTEKGWTKITRIMVHKTTKQLFRVVTHTGIVDVTEDHSLLNEYTQEVTPNQLQAGMKLLHHDLPNPQGIYTNMDEEKAWLWGFFMAEGTCGVYNCPSGIRASWSLSNQDHGFLDKALDILTRIEPDYVFKLDLCMKSSNVDKVSARGSLEHLSNLADRYDKLFYTERSTTMRQNKATDNGIRFKKVPHEILMATNNIKQAFLEGWYDGDGYKGKDSKWSSKNMQRFDIKGQIGAAGLYLICAALGYKTSVNTRTDKEEIYSINLTTGKQRKNPDIIKKIIPLGTMTEDVFDLETENHHFAAGIGRMVVHNSAMCTLPQIKSSKECNYWGIKLAQDINGIKPGEKDVDGVLWPEGRLGVFPPPLAVEFEKAMRLLTLKKKKYVALLIAKDGTFKTEDITDKHGNVIGRRPAMLKKGIPLARRDNCNFLRVTYTKILGLIMSRSRLDEAINVLVASIQDLTNNKIHHDELSIIRGLGANYKSDSYFMKVFSDNLRRAGKIVNPGDRLDFVIVESEGAKLLGDKMRLVEQFVEDGGVIDTNYYIEKILMNCVNQLFEVGFKDMVSLLSNVGYKPKGKRKMFGLDKPINIIVGMNKDGYNIEYFAKAVQHNVEQIINPPIILPPILNILPKKEEQEPKPVILNILPTNNSVTPFRMPTPQSPLPIINSPKFPNISRTNSPRLTSSQEISLGPKLPNIALKQQTPKYCQLNVINK